MNDNKKLYSKLEAISKSENIASALINLFKQQYESGFVLSDPSNDNLIETKHFFDDKTNINFCAQWNPNRELRLNHNLLIKRGIINSDIDQSRLINFQNNKPCYLCANNIAIQNPLEVLYPVQVAGSKYFIGANFAPITENHFTIMSEDHIPQNYNTSVLNSMFDFTDITKGIFKSIFNGRAGASILSHLHFQSTTRNLPIQEIHFRKNNLISESLGVMIYKPHYYLPLFLLEGEDKDHLVNCSNKIINLWSSLNPTTNTQNIITTKYGSMYRAYIFLRQTTKLIGTGKVGDMGTFESSGLLVLSKGDIVHGKATEEREFFENCSLDAIKNLLIQITPEQRDIDKLQSQLSY